MSKQARSDAEWRALLEERLQELEALRAMAQKDLAPVALDQQSVGRLSRMDAMQVQAMAKANEQRRIVEGHRIRAALRRLEEGEFGFCLDCGEPIPTARLAVDPASPLCIACASIG